MSKMVTHVCTYAGDHPDMTKGKSYDCSADRAFFHTFDDNGINIMLPDWHFVVKQNLVVVVNGISPYLFGDGNLSVNGAKTGRIVINPQPSDSDYLDEFGKPIVIEEEELNASDYQHRNATRKANEIHKDTKSTKELRKYRYKPDVT